PLKTQKKKPKNLQKREIFHIFAEGKAALGNLKASFHCARLHYKHFKLYNYVRNRTSACGSGTG
ncbi:MAG: hypothetical protein KHY47_14130, partial [Prevotella sp.]|nr:hypothetical protein [Prevotella sp.]